MAVTNGKKEPVVLIRRKMSIMKKSNGVNVHYRITKMTIKNCRIRKKEGARALDSKADLIFKIILKERVNCRPHVR